MLILQFHFTRNELATILFAATTFARGRLNLRCVNARRPGGRFITKRRVLDVRSFRYKTKRAHAPLMRMLNSIFSCENAVWKFSFYASNGSSSQNDNFLETKNIWERGKCGWMKKVLRWMEFTFENDHGEFLSFNRLKVHIASCCSVFLDRRTTSLNEFHYTVKGMERNCKMRHSFRFTYHARAWCPARESEALAFTLRRRPGHLLALLERNKWELKATRVSPAVHLLSIIVRLILWHWLEIDRSCGSAFSGLFRQKCFARIGNLARDELFKFLDKISGNVHTATKLSMHRVTIELQSHLTLQVSSSAAIMTRQPCKRSSIIQKQCNSSGEILFNIYFFYFSPYTNERENDNRRRSDANSVSNF